MKNSLVCVDANLIVRALIPGPLTENALVLVDRWRQNGVDMVAPALLAFEVTSVLRRLVFLGQINAGDGDEAFVRYQQFQIRLSHRKEIFPLAWSLAKKHGRPRAYDMTYVALAQLSGCEFWTADERLFNAVGTELAWVKWVGTAPIG